MVMWIAELELMVSVSCNPHRHSSEARLEEGVVLQNLSDFEGTTGILKADLKLLLRKFYNLIEQEATHRQNSVHRWC